jgi:hypothetical protein
LKLWPNLENMNCQKCRHTEIVHQMSIAYPIEPLCYDCFGNLPVASIDPYHEFQMDNLDLIEKLAMERGLI